MSLKARLASVAALVGSLILTAPKLAMAAPGAFSTITLNGNPVSQLVVDPANSHVIYAAGSDSNNNAYVFKSFDGGSTWASIGSGVGPMGVYAMAVSKVNDQIVYVGGYNYAAHAIALYQSTNGGASWAAVASGLGDNSVQSIALDPTNATISYVGLNHGLAKSTDGVTWNLVPGMGNNNVHAVALDRNSPPILYVGTDAATSGGVWKSGDSGGTWAPVTSGLAGGSVQLIAIDPTISSTIYAAVAPPGTSQIQLAKTVNSGGSWSTIRQADPMTALVVDPLNGLNVYFETANAVYRSSDGALTWTAIYNQGGGGFALDTQATQTLYAGLTNGLATYTTAPPPQVQVNPAPSSGPTGVSLTFPQTNHTVSGIWLTFLRNHGDVDNLGYPRSEIIIDPLNTVQTVQYFQRLVLEYHPEQQPTYQLQRRLLGDILYPGVDPAVDATASRPAGDSVYFPNNTGQGFGHFVANVAPDGSPTHFKEYFDSHGKEDAFGYPKEEPKQRPLADGQLHWTQRFQAAVFEYHPENDKDGLNPNGVPYRNYRVQLELLGDEYIAKNNLNLH
ncbi:MAG: hypothetical protein JO247_01330 [Chloroflexi bacterium]|nr:hypothetical protein [Chloroflexota bacterium]